MNGSARVVQLVSFGGSTAATISCDPAFVPSPGRYVLAHEPASEALLATPLFLGQSSPGGFVTASPIPYFWRPGSHLNLRGPLGRGFTLPARARRVALVAQSSDVSRLLPLASTALDQSAAVTLVCDDPPDQLPLQMEVQPQRALGEVAAWCDYAAYDVQQESLAELLKSLSELRSAVTIATSQVLVLAPMPCGGLADCGVCSVRTPQGYSLACVDGPVFDLESLLGRI